MIFILYSSLIYSFPDPRKEKHVNLLQNISFLPKQSKIVENDENSSKTQETEKSSHGKDFGFDQRLKKHRKSRKTRDDKSSDLESDLILKKRDGHEKHDNESKKLLKKKKGSYVNKELFADQDDHQNTDVSSNSTSSTAKSTIDTVQESLSTALTGLEANMKGIKDKKTLDDSERIKQAIKLLQSVII